MAPTQFNSKFATVVADLAVPLFAIAAWSTLQGMAVGSAATIWAASLATLVVKVAYHFGLRRALDRADFSVDEPGRYVVRGCVNAVIALGFAVVLMHG